jgi:amino acid transporter
MVSRKRPEHYFRGECGLVEKVEKAEKGHGFGTAPVFLTSICTILGAIMFLRFGWAVGNVGLTGALLIIVIGHAITIPTGLAISEIATNLKVGGGGEYFLLSRSFGTRIGASIGIMLYASQVISIAFYVIAFAEGFGLYEYEIERILYLITGMDIAFDYRMISLPLILGLFALILTRGANIGVKLLWGIFAILLVGIAVFMIGPPMAGATDLGNLGAATEGRPWIYVFAICFPAFTGMTAGVGLSGDLKNPRKSIPYGIMSAIGLGFFIYIAIMIKLYFSASPEDLVDLANHPVIMYEIAGMSGPKYTILGKDQYLIGIIVIVALLAATISSAVGSVLIAPRTLQAMGGDKIIPQKKVTNLLGEGIGKKNEPVNATFISAFIALIFVLMGDLNVVARLITMFFLITYGSVCAVSFLEHFAGNPSYRPTFRTKWYLSLLGMILCFGIMLQMDVIIALLSIGIMAVLYISLGFTHKESRTFAIIFQGVMFQLSRYMKIALQKSQSEPDKFNWRPSVIAISSHAVERSAPKDILKWISHHYGFGTLIHYIKGKLSKQENSNSRRIQKVLINQIIAAKANYTVTTVVSPSFTTAVAQSLQISGISGLDNNTILFEFNRNRSEELPDIVEGCKLAQAVDFNQCVLRSTEHNFGYRENIHIWIKSDDFKNANLMILMAFIIMEHPDWGDSEITIFTAFPKGEKEMQVKRIKDLISRGRLPISVKNVKALVYTEDEPFKKLLYNRSKNADLTVVGFTPEQLSSMNVEVFTQYEDLQETLFVCAGEDILIS